VIKYVYQRNNCESSTIRNSNVYQAIPFASLMKIMQEEKIYGWIFIFFILILFPCSQVCADGGFVSRESVAVSVDQRAILIKNGNAVSMTFSTGYTGEGEDFGWIIPTPVPPAIEDVDEAGESGENAFKICDEYSAPKIFTSHGCFPSGTVVITARGPPV